MEEITLLERIPSRRIVLFLYPINNPRIDTVPTPATVDGIVEPRLETVLDTATISALDAGTMAYEIVILRPFEVEEKDRLMFFYKRNRDRFNVAFDDKYKDYGTQLAVKVGK